MGDDARYSYIYITYPGTLVGIDNLTLDDVLTFLAGPEGSESYKEIISTVWPTGYIILNNCVIVRVK